MRNKSKFKVTTNDSRKKKEERKKERRNLIQSNNIAITTVESVKALRYFS
jgi:hypothetical protein